MVQILPEGLRGRQRFAWALGVGALAGLAVLANAQQPGIQSAGTLRVGFNVEPDKMDPHQSVSVHLHPPLSMLMEGLFKLDRDGQPKPLLATGWQASPDGVSYTFTIRKGVKFHDGTELNAQAVKASFDRMIDPKIPNGLRSNAFIDQIAGTIVVDPEHVKVTWKKRLSETVVLQSLTTIYGGVISPASITAEGNNYQLITRPVGTGPYKFKELVRGDHFTLVRNDSYWGTRPTYAEQVFRIVPEDVSREALILAGQVDVMILPPASDVPRLQAMPNLRVLLPSSSRSVFMVLNTAGSVEPRMKDPRVRQAINYAVNREAIAKNVLFGLAELLDSPMPKIYFGYCKAGEYRYNPEKAKQLLKEAGASDLRIKMVSSTGRYVQDIQAARVIAGDLRNVGIAVEGPTTMEGPSYIAAIHVPPARSPADMAFLGWLGLFPHPQSFLQIFLTANHPPAGYNTGYFSDAEVDKLVVKALSESDRAVQKADYCAIQKRIWEQAPWLFLWTQKFPIVHSTKVTDVGFLPPEWFDTTYARPTS